MSLSRVIRQDVDAIDFVDPEADREISPAEFLRQRLEAVLQRKVPGEQARAIYHQLMGHMLGTTIRTGTCQIAPGLGRFYTQLLHTDSAADSADTLPLPVIRYREGDAVRIMLGKLRRHSSAAHPQESRT